MFGSHRAEPAVGVSRMVQHHNPDAGGGADFFHELRPVRQFRIGHGAGGGDGEGVEVAGRGRDLVAGDGGEIGGGLRRFLHGSIIGVMIMVGGHGELDSFSGDGVHAFMFGGIAMAAPGERVDVGVGGDQARRGYFPRQGKLNIRWGTGACGDCGLGYAVLKPAGSVDRVLTGQQIQAGAIAASVHNAGTVG